MTNFEYHRPKTLDEALALLGRAVPLGGGTTLVPERRKYSGFIDLQDLKLDELRVEKDQVIAGAALKLQAIVDHPDQFPEALVKACQQEAGANIRNAATLAGRVLSCDGRSPLVTALLVLDAKAILEPGSEVIDLANLLSRRENRAPGFIVTKITIARAARSAYLQVGRSPSDLPIICAAASNLPGSGNAARLQISLGGFGKHPVRVFETELGDPMNIFTMAEAAAGKACEASADAWASREYRTHVAAVLAQRLVQKVVA